MSRIKWDETGEHLYETGVKNGVLYLYDSEAGYSNGYAWNGLTSVSESPSGAEANPLYADDTKYLNLFSAEEFGATVEAYTYPDEFGQCDGSDTIADGVSIGQQTRKTFGLCYKTTLGNDVQGNDYGYKLHLIYGCTASPSEKSYGTINDSPEAITFSWEVTTVPVNVTGKKSTACVIIDSTKVDSTKLSQLEDILYGTNAANPRLPLPDEIAELIGGDATYAVANYLTNVTSNNAAKTASGTYEATLSAVDGYTIANVIVIMNGADVTSTAYTSGTHKIDIDSVTGPIIITATANAG